MLEHVWVIPAIPALSFLLILAFGKKLPRGGSEIGIAALALCFVLAIATGIGWIQRVNDASHHSEPVAEAVVGHESGATPTTEATSGHGTESTSSEATSSESSGGEGEHVTRPVVRQITWFQNGGVKITVGTLLDGLSAMMLFVVTTVSLLVHIFSTDYVDGDRRYTHYFAFLSLFSASMLFFVISKSTLQMIVGWELVGLCSFVLIGHWWEEKPNSDAALKAFLTNRVGDIGLLVGMIVLFWATGSFDVLRIDTLANTGDISHSLLLLASCCLMAAVMSKSGQFVLHTWLPDAMAGPTPVSALIHAATMVCAGVFMVARLYPVFWHGLSIGTANINLMAFVGAFTLLFGAFLAFVQDDIKKVLAYSTISQLGYMVMALGVGAWTAGVFHLFTHAFFKAGLFLGAGSLAHHIHSFDMKKDMGGMRRRMPVTFWTFSICTLALAGFMPFAGFWSKDEILAGAGQLGGQGNYKLMLWMGTLGALCTAAYMGRVMWYAFWGEPRGKSAEHELHENGPRITVPLVVLAGLATVAGLANLPRKLFGWQPGGFALRFEHYVEPTGAYFPSGTDALFRHPEFSPTTAIISTGVVVLGFLFAYLWYWREMGPHGITRRNGLARFGYSVLVNKYYLDWLYTDVIVAGVKGPIARAAYWFNQNVLDGIVNGAGTWARQAGNWVYRYIDQDVIDGTVNGSGLVAEGAGEGLRQQQTGKVQAYGAYLFGGAAVLAIIFVIVVST